MSSYSEYDLEHDLREARRARARARGDSGSGVFDSGGIGAFVRSRTTDHWIMFAIGLVVGALLC